MGIIKYIVKINLLIIILTEMLFFLICAVSGDLSFFNDMQQIFIFFFAIILPIISYLSSGDLLKNAAITEEIYKILGVQEYRRFYINKFSLSCLNPGIETSNKMYVFDFNKVLEAHYKKYGIRQAS